MILDLEALDVREYQEGDMPYLVDIDIKANEDCFELSDWQELRNYFEEWVILVVTENETPIGFIVFEDFDNKQSCLIHRTGIQRKHRQSVVFPMLINVLSQSCMLKKYDLIALGIPEFECYGSNDPYDKTQMLLTSGFNYTQTLKDTYKHYGKYQDIYHFEKHLTTEDTNE